MSLPDVTDASDVALLVEGVTKSFGGLRALDAVSVRIGPAEVVGLIGPNGSGKTTLINVVTGFIKPDAGRVTVRGVDVTGLTPSRVAPHGLARTFQAVKLFSNLTVIENVEVAAVSIGMTRRDARLLAVKTLNSLGVPWERKVYPAELSAYELRRTEIARALATSPRVLLIDEPAAGCTEVESEQLLETLHRVMREEGCGTLVVDHDVDLILRLCTRVYVLNEGAVIYEGAPEEVSTDPGVVEAYLGTSRRESSRART
jgi:branched-chain amino acid transport system ATP-binding protein